MDLKIALEQKQVLSQRMIQSVEILQMNVQELDSFLKELTLENPLVELEDNREVPPQKSDMQRKLEWLEAADEQNRVYYGQEYEEEQERDAWNLPAEEENLPQYVLSQLMPLAQTSREEQIYHYLAYSLDSRGYLEEMPQGLCQAFGLTPEEAAAYLKTFQSVEPAGVGAADLTECLLLQLRRQRRESPLAETIIARHLELLGKNQLPRIASLTGASLEEVEEACRQIRALNPIPGSGFSSREHLRYILPDVTVVKFQGYFEVLLNDNSYSKVVLSHYYVQMLKEDPSPETQSYIGEKLKQAEWVISCIQQRGNTLQAVARALVECQREFFEQGPGHLQPLRLLDVAEKVGVHESTVSRAVRDKYLQCTWGIYPMNYFFTYRVAAQDGQIWTPEKIRDKLRELIEEEDKKKPLSDQKLTDLLQAAGVGISRRTVAKYRMEMGLPDASGRKSYRQADQ